LLKIFQIPIEICPTSNLITRAVESIDEHPFSDFYIASNRNYPLVICTDDCGIFNTSLTREQHLICQAFKINSNELFDLNKRAINYIFDKSPTTIEKLAAQFKLYEDSNILFN
jgi:adenosine deaminase